MSLKQVSVDELIVVGYADTLSEDLVPRLVAPIFCLRGSPNQFVLPPFKLNDGAVAGFLVSSDEDFERAIAQGQATRIAPIPARSGYQLWIDQDFSARYEPAGDVAVHLRNFAKDHVRKAKTALKEGRYDVASQLAQAAIAADERCLDALLVKAIVQKQLGHEDEANVLAEIAAAVAPDVDVASWVDLYQSVGETESVRQPFVDQEAELAGVPDQESIELIGRSAAWREVVQKATRVAATDTTVLLEGETGTGKEFIARFIHLTSKRKNAPFVTLNCAGLPEQLLESELFGYERGAFTGAQQSKPGKIELASGGVVFLDEVSEMSLSAQAKFLRVLQEREFQRLGGTRPLKANVRVIAATSRDLQRAIERGTFREDLFYRLQVFDIAIPPLRERKSDILPLSESFLQEIGKSFGRPPAGLTRDAKDALLQHTWPGNVRELRNALERAAILYEGGLITAQHLSLVKSPGRGFDEEVTFAKVERLLIERALKDAGWNKAKTAQRLGLTRTQLYTRLRKYDLLKPASSLEADEQVVDTEKAQAASHRKNL